MRKHLRRKSDKAKVGRLAAIVVALVLLGLVAPTVFKVVGSVVLYPVHQVQYWLKQSNMVIPVLWRDKIAMQEEIEELEQQVAVMSRTDVAKQRLFAENNHLRELLHNNMATRTLAVVVAKPTELPYDLLQIDRGSADGIEVGSPVYIGRDSVIGLVSSVYNRRAFVTLFTTPDFLATVYLSGADVTATLEGLGGGVARVKVPQGIPMQVGDLVHVPSVQPGLYGEIAWVESEPTQPEQYGYITPQIPIKSLYQVAVGQATEVSTADDFMDQNIQGIKKESLLVSDFVLSNSTSTATSTDAAASSTESDI